MDRGGLRREVEADWECCFEDVGIAGETEGGAGGEEVWGGMDLSPLRFLLIFLSDENLSRSASILRSARRVLSPVAPNAKVAKNASKAMQNREFVLRHSRTRNSRNG